ncbi:winged helix-turn-helix transcriptional regulator [Candidatus Woesearchaeota archaeon]|nr:winged helix-turn-helix transcriptional regulator [Candidatus Woesearchaeota archaeon]
MEKYIVIGTVHEDLNPLFIGIRDFPTKRLILLVPESKLSLAKKAKQDIEKFKIEVIIKEIEGNVWEALFENVAKVKNEEQNENIIVNTSSGDRNSQCALTSAAFVNGLKAFAVESNETMLLPILKFSYYKILMDRKMKILKILYNNKTCSLNELSEKANMSLPLISYHINGTPKSEGLKTLGLVEIKEGKGNTIVQLSMMGRLLVKGYC